MPSIYDPNKDEDQEDQQNNDQNGLGTGIIQKSSGEGSSISPGSAAPATNTAKGGSLSQRQGSSSGRFTNLQNYIQANKQGSAQVTGELGNRIGQSVTKAQDQIGQAKDQSLGQLNTTAQEAQAKAQAAKTGVQSLAQGNLGDQNIEDFESTISQGLQPDLLRGVKDTSFDRQRQDLGKVTQGLVETGKQVQTEGGKEALLNRYFGRPDYTKGQSNLDRLLLGGSKENINQLNQIRKQTRQLNPHLQNVASEFEQAKTKSISDIQAERDALQQELTRQTADLQEGQEPTGLMGQLQQRVNQYNQELAAKAGDLGKDDLIRALRDSGVDAYFDPTNNKISFGGKYADLGTLSSDNIISDRYLQNTFNEADLSSIDPEAAARLNVLRRLGGQAELNLADQAVTPVEEALRTNFSDRFTSELNRGLGELRALPQLKDQGFSGQMSDANWVMSHAKAALERGDNTEIIGKFLSPEDQAAYNAAIQASRDPASRMGSDAWRKAYSLNQKAVENAARQKAYLENEAKKQAIRNRLFGAQKIDPITSPVVAPPITRE